MFCVYEMISSCAVAANACSTYQCLNTCTANKGVIKKWVKFKIYISNDMLLVEFFFLLISTQTNCRRFAPIVVFNEYWEKYSCLVVMLFCVFYWQSSKLYLLQIYNYSVYLSIIMFVKVYKFLESDIWEHFSS